jgi:hypothetical protein
MESPRPRDPANELYDQGCEVLAASQALRAASTSPGAVPSAAATLGCLEAAFEEIAGAVGELRAAVYDADVADILERRRAARRIDDLRRDLRAVQTGAARSRHATGRLLEPRRAA